MIKGKKIKLRALEKNDLEKWVRWLNDAEVTKFTTIIYPFSMEEEEEWYRKTTADQNIKNFIIETLKGKAIGGISLNKINWKDRNAELGIVIGEKDFWNKGYGTDAVRTLLDFTFSEMNLHRIYLRVFAYNKRALRAYEKCGFKVEGEIRDDIFRDGRYHNSYFMGILSGDFKKGMGQKSHKK